MDPIVYEHLDECIELANRLISLQDEDSMRIRTCLQGEQQDRYQGILSIEQEKLENFKQNLQSLQEAQSLL